MIIFLDHYRVDLHVNIQNNQKTILQSNDL